MSNKNQHIENWLKQSASEAPNAINEAHWQSMKVLLEQKTKRRFGFWWWCLLIIIVGSITCALLLKNNAQKIKSKSINNKITTVLVDVKQEANNDSSKIKITKSHKSDSTSIKKYSNYPNEKSAASNHKKPSNSLKYDDDKKTLSNTQKTIDVNNKNVISNNVLTHPKIDFTPKELMQKQKNQKINLDQKNIKYINLHSAGVTIPKQNNFQLESIDSSEIYELNDVKKHFNYNNETTVCIEREIFLPLNIYGNRAFKLNDSLISSSLKNKLKKPISSNNKKSFWQISFGIGNGSVPIEAYHYNFNVNYNKQVVSNFYIQTGLDISKLNSTEIQNHFQINKISPILGTTRFLVDTRNTNITIHNAWSLQPTIGLNYKTKKIQLGIAYGFGKLLNISKTLKYRDSFYIKNDSSFLPLNNAFDENNITGSNFSSLQFSLQYKFLKNKTIGFQYQYLLSRNTQQGILVDEKQRSILLLKLGIIF